MALSLADTLAAQRTRPGPRCPLSSWLADRPDADAVLECFHRDDVTGLVLSQWLTAQGLEMSRMMVDHHRRGQCATCADAGLDVRRRP